MTNIIETTDKALARRIKQHVVGRPQSFFAVVPPGLEPLCRDELAGLEDPPDEMTVTTGGIEFTGRLTTCYQANLICRTASRILMRIGHFKARHFDMLAERTRAIAWELYLKFGIPLDIRVTARQSKLYHSQAIADRIQNAVAERLGAAGQITGQDASNKPDQRLWVRLENDRASLSLDSSGTHLHKRGIKTGGGPAPLRETLAAAALTLSGFQPGTVLCDPMCGSGTFALEAALMAKQIPPGWQRTFAFEGWPAFRPPHWQYLRRQAAARFRTLAGPQIFASDRSRKAVDGLAALLPESGLADAIDLQQRDFFDLTGPALSPTPGLITLNPPYGRRLGKPEATGRLIGEILHKLQEDFRGWQALLVLPEKRLLRQFPFKIKSQPVMHGGQPVWLATGKVPS